VGQRQDEQRVGEQADLGAGIGQLLSDTGIAPERRRRKIINGRIDTARFAHPQDSTRSGHNGAKAEIEGNGANAAAAWRHRP
jgi:hypothetical protein